jgi:hypothetical protein
MSFRKAPGLALSPQSVCWVKPPVRRRRNACRPSKAISRQKRTIASARWSALRFKPALIPGLELVGPCHEGDATVRRRRGLNWAIGTSCLRDGLQHPHILRQETLTKSRCARRGSGFVQSFRESASARAGIRFRS